GLLECSGWETAATRGETSNMKSAAPARWSHDIHPGESHGVSRPSFQKDRDERYPVWHRNGVKAKKG
ncbi:MAG TPA: hypothetical protein VGD06_16160, partial [Acidobacteriota bacterium]